jgi:hypothetical protein
MKIKDLFRKKSELIEEVIEVTAPPTEQIEIKVAGFDHYQRELKKCLHEKNEDYKLSAKAFREEVFERCYEYETEWLLAEIVPEPENEHDPNALAVYVDNVRIGYIPKKDQKKVNSVTLINAYAEIYGGNFKETDEYDEIVRGSTPYKAMLHLTIEKEG